MYTFIPVENSLINVILSKMNFSLLKYMFCRIIILLSVYLDIKCLILLFFKGLIGWAWI